MHLSVPVNAPSDEAGLEGVARVLCVWPGALAVMNGGASVEFSITIDDDTPLRVRHRIIVSISDVFAGADQSSPPLV